MSTVFSQSVTKPLMDFSWQRSGHKDKSVRLSYNQGHLATIEYAMQGAIYDAMCNIKDPTSDKLLVMADGGAKRSTVLGVWQQKSKH